MFWLPLKIFPFLFLLIGIISSRFTPIISKEEKIIWKWELLKQPEIMRKILAFGYTFCYLGFTISMVFRETKYLPVGIINGGVLGIIWGLMVYILIKKDFSSTINPYQRLSINSYRALPFGIYAFLSLFIYRFFILEINVWHNLLHCLFLGFSMFITLTLTSPFFQHMVLRLCFWFEGSIPLRLVHFLNYATDDLLFLERDGGSWRFRHQILQDYFAGLAEKDKKE